MLPLIYSTPPQVAPPYPAGRVSSQETACAARPAHNEPDRAAKLLGRPPDTDGVS
jgi:hypothetical protein